MKQGSESDLTPGAVQAAERQKRQRLIVFRIGDCLFLCLVGGAAALAMHLAHQLNWGFVPTWIIGMSMAMALQAFLACLAAPILGTIESMIPSMIVAMASSMLVCALHLMMGEEGLSESLAGGGLLGLGLFFFVEAYDAACKKSLHRFFPGR
jgi:hypothetical protein